MSKSTPLDIHLMKRCSTCTTDLYTNSVIHTRNPYNCLPILSLEDASERKATIIGDQALVIGAKSSLDND